ncbi:MAG TPA: hypothetical protein K8V30_09300 [Metalysinibacillus jejuensis]|uniref:Uncharacterized protein n=1 Tax=Metalysinibacillus jejuensis TaxID=914327 RepID=A0A921NC90_9BACL|nr:hypothetical protein [Metalysinibacillus jejuensis]
MAYMFLLFAHILSAVLSIGPLFVLLPLLTKMKTATDDQMKIYLIAFQAAITVVKHAGHVVVPTGFLLIWLGGFSWLTSWAVATLAVMVGSVFFLAAAFKPTIKTFQTAQYNQSEFVKKLRRSVWLYIFLLLIMLWLMVAKPALW